eukprot:gnl/Trimastix_PCT/4510.p1 GENE.gnl/Trimastix_PCT/4510~~gnl/Trimastix_PCT/4510.p1  ORF type:complete len:277 (+),score=26.37 gnl/Trimastix_PCT/4510:35-865(+)
MPLDFPEEILGVIFSNLEVTSLRTCSCVCSQWRNIISHMDFFWESLYRARFGGLSSYRWVDPWDGGINQTWKDCYESQLNYPHADNSRLNHKCMFAEVDASHSGDQDLVKQLMCRLAFPRSHAMKLSRPTHGPLEVKMGRFYRRNVHTLTLQHSKRFPLVLDNHPLLVILGISPAVSFDDLGKALGSNRYQDRPVILTLIDIEPRVDIHVSHGGISRCANVIAVHRVRMDAGHVVADTHRLAGLLCQVQLYLVMEGNKGPWMARHRKRLLASETTG